MARKSVVNRNTKRIRLAAMHRVRRDEARAKVRDPRLSVEERQRAIFALQKMPRDGSAVRVRNRCLLTGRPRGVFRRFGLGRTKVRELAMNGEIPGVIKASW